MGAFDRQNRFFSDKDFRFAIKQGNEFIEQDVGQTIYYYVVNREESDTDSLYGETFQEDIILESPIPIKAMVEFEDQTQEAYNDNNTVVFTEEGNITCKINISQLKENNLKICRGDFVAYRFDEDNTMFYKIFDDGRVVENNRFLFGGYKPYFIEIKGTPINKSEIGLTTE